MRATDLFAAKMHAALYRQWKNRVKGRDWYDTVWFIRQKIPLNLQLLGKMMQKAVDHSQFLKLARARIDALDIAAAKRDIIPFLQDPAEVENWSASFFHYWFDRIIT